MSRVKGELFEARGSQESGNGGGSTEVLLDLILANRRRSVVADELRQPLDPHHDACAWACASVCERACAELCLGAEVVLGRCDTKRCSLLPRVDGQ